MTQIYDIRIQSPYILTARQVKDKIGIGYKVLSVETERDAVMPDIVDVDSAVESIIKVGYRSLARAYHPDLGGDASIMGTLTVAKKQLIEVIQMLKG